MFDPNSVFSDSLAPVNHEDGVGNKNKRACPLGYSYDF